MPKRTAKTLTVAAVDKIRPPETGRKEHFDAVMPGLCLRVSHTGSKSWAYYYRHGGRNRRYTIGSFPAIPLDKARDQARGLLIASKQGEDPAAKKQAEKRKNKHAPDSVQAASELFIERYAKPNNRSWKDSEQIFRIHVLPRWAKRDVKSIVRRDVIALLDDVTDATSAVRANRIRAQLSRFFNWCLEREIIDISPVAGTRPPGKEKARDRVLTDDEILAVWDACTELSYPYGDFFKMLLLTSQREGETAKMRWSDLDLENCIWSIPREMTKADRAHEVPLSNQVVDLLRSLPRTVDWDYVFCSGRRGDSPINGFGKSKKRCDEISGVTDWRLHDLRRTAASGMARLGIGPHVVEKVQNRQSGVISGVSAVYNRYAYTDEKRAALQAWANFVDDITGNSSGNTVIPIRS